MGEELLLKLIEVVESAAPKLWGIALRQVYVKAAQNAFFLIIAMITIVPAFRSFVKAMKKIVDYSMDVESERILWFLVTTLAVVTITGTAIAVIGYLVNPEYYAIEILSKLAGQ